MRNEIKERYKEKKILRNMAKENKTEKRNIIIKAITILLIVIIMISFLRNTFNPNATYSFTKFLEDMVRIGNYQINIINLESFIITADWGIANFLRDFINLFSSAIGLILWLSQTIFNIMTIVRQVMFILVFGT